MKEDTEEHAMTAEGAERSVQEAIGFELKAAREAAGRSVQEIAADLKLTATAVGYIENGQWARLGAPVYVRGYIRAFGRLVDVDVARADALFEQQEREASRETVAIMASARRQSSLIRYQRFASYLLVTALLAIPAVVWLTRAFDGSVFKPTSTESARVENEVSVPGADAEVDRVEDRRSPMLASMTGIGSRTAEPEQEITDPEMLSATVPGEDGSEQQPGPEDVPEDSPAVHHTLTLEFSEEVWLDVRDAEGQRLAFGLKPAGSVHTFEATKGIKVRVGNADAVAASLDGEAFDLKPHMRRDVAEFTLGDPDGAL